VFRQQSCKSQSRAETSTALNERWSILYHKATQLANTEVCRAFFVVQRLPAALQGQQATAEQSAIGNSSDVCAAEATRYILQF
jgi:hypothetical protein